MAKREPTIEQNSHFSAKTKEGQDVEFEATLKFYITPSGQVSLSVPGGKQTTGSTTVVTPPAQESAPPRTPERESSEVRRQEVDRSGSNTRVQTEKRAMSDETIDRAFPRGPDHPSGECSIKQFIPDPCKAVDDAVKSIKGLYNNFFSGPKCPPPTNTDNVNLDYMTLYKKSERDFSEKPAEVMDNEDNENKEMMENEQKYDM